MHHHRPWLPSLGSVLAAVLVPVLVPVVASGCGGGSAELEPAAPPAPLAGAEPASTPATAPTAPTPTPAFEEPTPDPAASVGLPNERVLGEGTLVTGGQPDEAALRRAAEAGVRTVITLRQPSEPGFEEERATVERLGMEHVSIPVAGAGGVTRANAEALDRALDEAEGKTVLHCGTGNRVGALLALRAFHLEGRNAEESLALGRQAGLTGLEDAVRAHFAEWCDQNPGAATC